jgi:hypothetical protein
VSIKQEVDYRQYYDLESYLFDTVRRRFAEQGYLNAFDFFCIVIWKANRAKSKIARKLLELSQHKDNLDAAVRELTTDLAEQTTAKERLRCLWEKWQFYLPTASAILTVLYPDEFTVYDWRVCDELQGFHDLRNLGDFESLWRGYEDFKRKVEESTPKELSLRDKDRYLWGKSFAEQLKEDIKQGFAVKPAPSYS